MNFFGCELTDVVHHRVLTARSFDLDKRELLGCLALTPLMVLHLATSLLSSLLLKLILGYATHASLLGRGKWA
jgi:hypothetical protein